MMESKSCCSSDATVDCRLRVFIPPSFPVELRSASSAAAASLGRVCSCPAASATTRRSASADTRSHSAWPEYTYTAHGCQALKSQADDTPAGSRCQPCVHELSPVLNQVT